MHGRSSRLAEIAARAAEAFVVLELDESYGLGFIAPNGRIVSTLHVVSDEKSITAHLSSGTQLDVRAVAGIDTKRDLAVLWANGIDVTPLLPPPSRLAEEGSVALTFSLSEDRRRTQWIETRISAIQVLSDGLAVYRIEGTFPPDLSGAPLVSAKGEVLGVVTQAQSDDGMVVLAVPFRYLAPLLGSAQQLPLSVLRLPKKRARRRLVPQHAMTILEGSSGKGLEVMANALAGAINVGAPVYNRGDVEACLRLYTETAQRLVRDRSDCPGPAKALRDGLERARALDDTDAKAWALRDTFDGLLMVIEKYLKARVAVAKGGGRKSKLLN
jgi:S1-C subfamily serine protease